MLKPNRKQKTPFLGMTHDLGSSLIGLRFQIVSALSGLFMTIYVCYFVRGYILINLISEI